MVESHFVATIESSSLMTVGVKVSEGEARLPLLVFDTHPIQYRSPVFKELAQRVPDLRVFYFSKTFNGDKWWFQERNKIPKQTWGRDLTEGFLSESLDTTSQSLFCKFQVLNRVFSRARPRMVVIYGYYLIEHWIVRFLCSFYGAKLVFIGETFESSPSLWRRLLKRVVVGGGFFSGVQHFLAIGNRTQNYYLKCGIPPHKISKASYCVDNAFFQVNPEESGRYREGIRAQLGIPQDAFVLLFVGRLFDRKRPLDVLALHRRLFDQTRFHTLLVGNGEMESQLASESAGIANLHLLGFKNQLELREIYYAADALYVPSEFETWGLVTNEAAVCGRPSIVTERTGVAGDLIKNGETGFVVPVGGISEAEKAIRSWLSDPELLNEMGERVWRSVTCDYRPEIFAEELFRILQRQTNDQSLLATR